MKILILSHNFYPFIGGIETNTELFANYFASRGNSVKVLTWSMDPSERTFTFEVLRDPGLKKIVQAHIWADIVFENNPCLRLAWPGFFIKRPFVVSLNTWIRRDNGKVGLQDRIKIWRLKRSSEIISVSYALKMNTAPSSKVIHNPYRKELFRLLPHVQKTKHFVFLGRLVSDKGAGMAIKAIADLKKNLSTEKISIPLSLTIIGDGPERDSLKLLVKELGLKKNVLFTGTLREEELVNCLNLHRFMLIPSVWEEPFGIIALEGMACGCVPIASNGGGLPEAVGPGGVLFRRGDQDDLVDTMLRIFKDPVMEIKCRNAAPAHLAMHHCEMIAEQYLNVLTRAASA